MAARSWWTIVAALISMMASAPVAAEWRRAESAHFVIFGRSSEQVLRQRLTLLEDFDRLLRAVTTVRDEPSPNKLHIYIVNNGRELRAIRPVPDGIAGWYAASAEGIAALVDQSAEMQGNQILFHEYVHHFMMQHRPNAYPAWYVEGFAEYFMTVRFSARGIDIGDFNQSRAYGLVNNPWLPLARILGQTTEGLNREQGSQYYAQSWLLTHYFYSTPERQAALGRYLAAVRTSGPIQALQPATGFTPETLTDELRRYIRGGRIAYRRMSRMAEVQQNITVTVLPRAADDMMIDAVALRLGIDEAQRPATLARIRAAAARHANDPFAMRVLAHAEAVYGDGAAADRLLDGLHAVSPNDAELMYLRGRRYLAAAEADAAPADAMRTARQWFGRAHRADGNHFQTLYRYAQTLRGEREYVSENTNNVLLLAHQLAPQVTEIAMNAAWLSLQREQYEDAARLLEPLAASPHNASLARAASEMLERARGRGAAPPAAAASPGRPPSPGQ